MEQAQICALLGGLFHQLQGLDQLPHGSCELPKAPAPGQGFQKSNIMTSSVGNAADLAVWINDLT